MIVFYFLIGLIISLCCVCWLMDFIYPLIYRDKFERKIAKVISTGRGRKRKSIDEMQKEIKKIYIQRKREEISKNRKEKLNRLKNI